MARLQATRMLIPAQHSAFILAGSASHFGPWLDSGDAASAPSFLDCTQAISLFCLLDYEHVCRFFVSYLFFFFPLSFSFFLFLGFPCPQFLSFSSACLLLHFLVCQHTASIDCLLLHASMYACCLMLHSARSLWGFYVVYFLLHYYLLLFFDWCSLICSDIFSVCVSFLYLVGVHS